MVHPDLWCEQNDIAGNDGAKAHDVPHNLVGLYDALIWIHIQIHMLMFDNTHQGCGDKKNNTPKPEETLREKRWVHAWVKHTIYDNLSSSCLRNK